MFDRIVLTASNEGQAEAYGAELAHRGLGPESTPKATVVPDPGGRRVGSGVSTLLALAHVARASASTPTGARGLDELFANQRVCVIHAGGDSRRLPAYAAHGKIFAPLPLDAPDARQATLFDLLLDDLSGLDLPAGRVAIASGDVYLGVREHALRFHASGAVGLAWADTPERGSRHGVYRLHEDGRVTGFFHKPSPEEAHVVGAISSEGRVLIDTGLVVLDSAIAAQWLDSGGVGFDGASREVRVGEGLVSRAIETGKPSLDLYAEMLPSMANGTRAAGVDWTPKAGAFTALTIPTCPFMHIGTTREFLSALTAPEGPVDNWNPVEPGGRVLNSRVFRIEGRAEGPVVVEGCDLDLPVSLAGDNVLVGVPSGVGSFALPSGWGMVCLPAHDEMWVAIGFGTEDDLKTPIEQGGTFGNMPMEAWASQAGIDPSVLWAASAERTLWNARLWTPAHLGPGFVDRIAWMWSGVPAPPGWVDSSRWSAAEVMQRVDHVRLLAHRDRVLGHG